MALTRLGGNQAINLATNTTGTLGVANGGTGLTSGTSGQFLKFTGSTTVASSALGDTGKVLQIQRKVLPTTVYVTGTTPTDIMNQTITPSAASSYIFALFVPNYIMSCNDNTSNPYGNVRIKQDSTTTNTKADSYLRDINSAGATNVDRNFIGSLVAYWNPNSTSAVSLHVCVENGTGNGRIGLFGDNSHTNATSLTLIEIGA
jgi:hypothetical protein